MTLRVRCCVPFCRRTRGQRKGEEPVRADTEWICGQHWMLVPNGLKAVRRRLRTRFHRTGVVTEAMHLANRRSWALCKRAAVEAAGGLA